MGGWVGFFFDFDVHGWVDEWMDACIDACTRAWTDG